MKNDLENNTFSLHMSSSPLRRELGAWSGQRWDQGREKNIYEIIYVRNKNNLTGKEPKNKKRKMNCPRSFYQSLADLELKTSSELPSNSVC